MAIANYCNLKVVRHRTSYSGL